MYDLGVTIPQAVRDAAARVVNQAAGAARDEAARQAAALLNEGRADSAFMRQVESELARQRAQTVVAGLPAWMLPAAAGVAVLLLARRRGRR